VGKTIAVIALSLASSLAMSQSKLIEIDRVGHTGSLQHFYTENSLSEEDKKALPKRFTPEEFYSKMLPIHSDSLSPGFVSPVKRAIKTLMRPVFVIGVDKKSIQWLKDNKDALIESKAVGMLVEVETIEQFREVGKLAKGLQISPTSGDELAKILGFKHYPVLISKYGFEQ